MTVSWITKLRLQFYVAEKKLCKNIDNHGLVNKIGCLISL